MNKNKNIKPHQQMNNDDTSFDDVPVKKASGSDYVPSGNDPGFE